MRRKPLTNKSGEVRELKTKDFKAMRPAREVLPPELLAVLPKRKRGERGLQKSPRKIPVTVRYSPEVVSFFKESGQGWQSRIDSVLKTYVKKQQKNASTQKRLKGSKSKKVA
jgi:uncharacterized protein (DUF4415 family)